jgi:hypothetical protein
MWRVCGFDGTDIKLNDEFIFLEMLQLRLRSR